MSAERGFDGVAWFYDPLARLVFGREMVDSQTHHLGSIPPGSSVLILGGGTGWIVDELFERSPDCTVWYIEASGKMLQKARRRGKSGRVHFIHGSWQDVPARKFDVVVTNYFLDLFTNQTLGLMIPVIAGSLHTDGQWLATDFTGDSKWHRIMLRLMYWFFGLVCEIEAKSLPAWEEAMTNAGFRQVAARRSFGGFMKSVLFDRQEDVPQ